MKRAKREHIPISKKQKALTLLGWQSDGTKGVPQVQQTTNKPYNHTTVSQELNVRRTSIYQWERKAVSIFNVSDRDARRQEIVRDADFPELET